MPACKVPATATAQEQNAMKAAQKPPKRGSKAKGASKARPKAKAASKALRRHLAVAPVGVVVGAVARLGMAAASLLPQ